MKKTYLTAQDLSNALGVSVSNAYIRIREMNNELHSSGYQVIHGKIPIAYAKEKFYGIDFEEVENGE